MYRMLWEKNNSTAISLETTRDQLMKFSGLKLKKTQPSILQKNYLNQMIYYEKFFQDKLEGVGLFYFKKDKQFGLVATQDLESNTYIGVIGYLSMRKGVTGFFPPLLAKGDNVNKNFYNSMDGTLGFVNHSCTTSNTEFVRVIMKGDKIKSDKMVPEVFLKELPKEVKQELEKFIDSFNLQSKYLFILKTKGGQNISNGKELLVN